MVGPGVIYHPDDMNPPDMNKSYIVIIRNYLTGDYDGYTSLKVPENKTINNEESGILISIIY
jgi:hypothetical protein